MLFPDLCPKWACECYRDAKSHRAGMRLVGRERTGGVCQRDGPYSKRGGSHHGENRQNGERCYILIITRVKTIKLQRNLIKLGLKVLLLSH